MAATKLISSVIDSGAIGDGKAIEQDQAAGPAGPTRALSRPVLRPG